MGKPCKVTFGDRVFFKPDFIKRFLDTLHLEDNVVEESKYLKSIGYDNAFNEGDPMLIREKKEEAKAEAEAIEEVEQYQPITIKDISIERFSKDNARDYEEDERETDSGRMSTYVSSMTMDVTNSDGDSVGGLTKLVDEDGIVSWNGEDFDGMPLADEDFDSKDEAKQAIVDKWNKEQKKEFDKEAKKAAKEKQKAKEKAAKAEEKIFTYDKDGNIVEATIVAKGKNTTSVLIDGKQTTRANTELFNNKEDAQTRLNETEEGNIFDDFDSTNKGKSIKSKAEANKAFKEKYGEDAAVAKAISSNFEAIADELKAKGIFTKIKC